MSIHSTSNRYARHGTALGVMLVGSAFVLGTVVVLNQFSEAPKKREVTEGTAIQVTKTPKPKPKQQVRKPKPKPRNTPKAPPPPSLAALSSGFGNFAIDLPGFNMDDVGGQAGDLLGGDGEVTHTSDTVDDPPVPSRQVPPEYPAALRNKGITGYVLLGMLVNEQGNVEQVNIIESQPPGAFDSAAEQTVRQWQFQPGRYKGEPVRTWVEQKMRFELGS